MADRIWPKRIHISQDGYGSQNADVHDAETGEHLTRVFRVVISRHESYALVTMSKYDPDEMAINHPGEPSEQGIAVDTRAYPIYRLSLDAGVQ